MFPEVLMLKKTYRCGINTEMAFLAEFARSQKSDWPI